MSPINKCIKIFRSTSLIFLVAIVLALVFLLHFVHFSGAPNEDISKNAIDILRAQNKIFTSTSNPQQEQTDFPTRIPPTRQNLFPDTKSSVDRAKTDDVIELPGAKVNHRILALSDAQFGRTPVNEMFSWYGEAEGGGTCSQDFGTTLINRWRDTKASYCHPTASSPAVAPNQEADGSLHSAIDCYLVHQTRHHGDGDNLCHMRNVAVDLALFADDTRTRSVVREYVNTMHAKQPYIKFPKGFIQGDCQPDQQHWQEKNMPGWNADLTVGAFQSVPSAASAQVCEEWVEQPVLVTQRDTFANFFHDSEDFFNVFIALAVLQWKPAQVQMFLTDLYPQGPFWDIWSKVFSQGSQDTAVTPGAMAAMTAWDLRQRFGKTPRGKKVCFRDLAIGIFGPAAPMTVASWDTPCSRTALVRAYSDYVIRGLGLQGRTHYATATPLDTVVVTYMARRPSKQWPEKKYCNSTHSFFDCELWAKFGERRLGRMIRNDQEVVAALKTLEGQSIGGARRIVVQDVDYNELTFEQQIATDLATDVMIGPHGAGLMHNIFMRDRAALIELFVDGSSVNRHFHNLAHWFGRRYSGLPSSNPIRIPDLLNSVKDAIRSIDVSTY